jgi:hypothetical protein
VVALFSNTMKRFLVTAGLLLLCAGVAEGSVKQACVDAANGGCLGEAGLTAANDAVRKMDAPA